MPICVECGKELPINLPPPYLGKVTCSFLCRDAVKVRLYAANYGLTIDRVTGMPNEHIDRVNRWASSQSDEEREAIFAEMDDNEKRKARSQMGFEELWNSWPKEKQVEIMTRMGIDVEALDREIEAEKDN